MGCQGDGEVMNDSGEASMECLRDLAYLTLSVQVNAVRKVWEFTQ